MRRSISRHLAPLKLLTFAPIYMVLTAHAEAGNITEAAATEGVTTPYLVPKMNPAATLVGKGLLDALRKGGYVLYMRHTETGNVTADCTASNLTPRGERDAARVGAAFRSLAIPLERILSSPVCRVQGTARHLGLGDFDIAEDLSNVTTQPGFDLHVARGKLLAKVPKAGKNTLLVSHMQTGNDFSQAIYLDFGEIVVFRHDGMGMSEAVGRMRVDDWATLVKGYANEKRSTSE